MTIEREQITHTCELKDGTRIHRYFNAAGELIRMITYGDHITVQLPKDGQSLNTAGRRYIPRFDPPLKKIERSV